MRRSRKPPRAEPTVPKDEDVDWQEVAAGLWPELKAKSADHACRTLRPLRPPASRCYLGGRRPDSPGRKTLVGTEGRRRGPRYKAATINSTQPFAELAPVAMECVCTSEPHWS